MLPRLIRPAAYAWIVSDEHVLLCRLCEPHNNGLWTIPGGGLEFGENAEEGCRREVKEETGLSIQLGNVLTIDTVCGEVNPVSAAREAKRLLDYSMPPTPIPMHSIRIVYLAGAPEGSLTDECGGSTDCARWIPLSEVRRHPLVDLTQTVLEAWELRARTGTM